LSGRVANVQPVVPLPARQEKRFQQRACPDFSDPWIDIRGVMAGRLAKETRPVIDRAAFLVAGAVVKPPDPGKGDRACAHGAGFERDVEIAIGQPLRVHLATGRTDYLHFGMCGRIVQLERTVSVPSQDLAVSHKNSPDGHLAAFRCAFGLLKSHIHERGLIGLWFGRVHAKSSEEIESH